MLGFINAFLGKGAYLYREIVIYRRVAGRFIFDMQKCETLDWRHRYYIDDKFAESHY